MAVAKESPSKSEESMAVAKEKRTLCGTLNNIRLQTTVEPMMLFHAASLLMMYVIAQSLKLYKVCRGTFGHPEHVCRNLSAYPEWEAESQRVASDLGMYWAIVQTVPSTVFTIFLGPWSDHYGRKIPMIIPLAGSSLAAVVYVFSAVFEELPPEFLLLGPALTGITGGISALIVAVFSYMADVSDEKERTTRMAFVYGFWFAGSPIGSALGGVLKHYGGYQTVFLVGAGFLTICLIYVCLRIKDVKVETERPESVCKAVFNLDNCKDSFVACLKKRPENRRLHLWLLTFAMCGIFLPIVGEGNVRFLYARLRFDWKDEVYSYYIAASMGVGAFGVIVILPILSKKAQMSDVSIALLALFARLISELMVAFSVAGWMMFLSAATLFGECAGPPIRSMMSKCVAPNEVGKMFTMLAVVEAGLPILSGVMYSKVYNATMKVFPGAVFLVTSFVYILVIISLLWLYLDLARLRKLSELKTSPTEKPSDEQQKNGFAKANLAFVSERTPLAENKFNHATEKDRDDSPALEDQKFASDVPTLQEITHL